MAKQIKAIKCPHCGSIGKTEVKADHFICNSCNTEYFLDNDDININHNINYNQPFTSATPANLKKVLLIIAVCIFAFFVILLLFPSPYRNRLNSYPVNEAQKETFYWHYKDAKAYVNAEGKPFVLIFGTRSYMGTNSDDKKNAVYATFYDMLTGKELKTQKLENIPSTTFDSFSIKNFSNGDMYAIANKTLVFKVDKSNYSLSDVTQSLFQGHAKLASGIANAEFAYDSYGDAFNLMSNEGANVFYYPIVNKIYTKDEVYAAQRALENPTINEELQTSYDFSSKSNDFPDEKIQLFKYTKKNTKGAPDDDVHLSWREQTLGKGRTLTMGGSIMRSYTDLTPGRLYFKPLVLYGDNEYVFLSTNKTAAEEAPTNLQCIDVSGKLIFTYSLPKNEYFYGAIRFKSGFLAMSHTVFYAIGMDGKLIKEFKLN